MRSIYVQEEVTVRRTAEKKNAAVWSKESAVLKRLQAYCEALQKQAVQEECGISRLTLETKCGPYTDFSQCSEVVWKAEYTQYGAYEITLEQLAAQDDTHCFEARAIIHFGDPSDSPQVFSKRFEDQHIQSDETVWQRAVPAGKTNGIWRGDLTCAPKLPNATAIPQDIIDAYHEITDRYCERPENLFETLVEEDGEGGMDGGGFEDFTVPGDRMDDFLARMQRISDMFKAIGGSWTVTNCLYSDDCSLLHFETDAQGKIKALYLKP